MICPNCGKEIEDNGKFCGYCGYKLVQDATPVTHKKESAKNTDVKSLLKNKKVLFGIVAVIAVVAVIALLMFGGLGSKDKNDNTGTSDYDSEETASIDKSALLKSSKDSDYTLYYKLSDYAGKKVMLYCDPKDNTAGCTKQACGFSERYPQFTEKGAVILGVSKDSIASHKKFEEKYGLAFTLLADPERKVIEAYDVWKEKKNYGKVSMGVVRTTYLINEQGVIIKANDKVKAANDPENMLKELD